MDDLEALQAQQAANRKYGVPSKVIKPCVAYILRYNPQSKISTSDDYAYLIATELRRIGEEKEKATIILRAWNSGNSHALRPNQLSGIIDRAYSKLYTYGCNNPMVAEHCQKKEKCSYYKDLFATPGKHRERHFYKYSWQQVLKNYETCLYYGLIEIEKMRKLKPGELIIAPYRLISKTSGVNIALITKGLDSLGKQGLIKWRKGQPFRWQEVATEIRRIVPIPRPK